MHLFILYLTKEKNSPCVTAATIARQSPSIDNDPPSVIFFSPISKCMSDERKKKKKDEKKEKNNSKNKIEAKIVNSTFLYKMRVFIYAMIFYNNCIYIVQILPSNIRAIAPKYINKVIIILSRIISPPNH